jgi:hypothetical protein
MIEEEGKSAGNKKEKKVQRNSQKDKNGIMGGLVFGYG